jgi:GNAT superfamily N-acetyltransferase
MTLEIVAVDPHDAARFEAWRAVLEASGRVEYGDEHAIDSLDELNATFREQRYERRLAWAAVRDGTIAGHLDVALPLTDNRHRLDFTLAVHPDHRRQRIGSALLEHVERMAHAEHRTVLGAESDVAAGHDDPAVGFAARHGFTTAQRELRSRLELPVDVAAARAEAEKHAEGYEVLTSWDGIPDEWLTDRALLSRRMSTDPPLGALDYAEEAWDTDRARRVFELAREQRRRVVETVARHQASGRLVGYTTLVVAAHQPDVAYQWDTLVLREHRGHRLGMLLKAANLEALLAELPGVRCVHTWNANENEPMLRVNRALGFQPIGQMTEWQRALTA